MAKYRVTLECVLDIEAASEEEALDNLPEYLSMSDVYILDTEELPEEEKAENEDHEVCYYQERFC